MTKKNNNQAGTEVKANNQAQAVFNAGMPDFSPKEKPTHTLSKWEEAVDKATFKQMKKDLFADMLGEMRGLAGNCNLFKKYAKDPRLEEVIRNKNIQVHPKDYAKVFIPDFLTSYLKEDRGGYRFNKAGAICRPTLPKKEEVAQVYEAAGYQSYTDKKSGKNVYLVPVSSYTFEQFLTLVKVAVANYREEEKSGYKIK